MGHGSQTWLAWQDTFSSLDLMFTSFGQFFLRFYTVSGRHAPFGLWPANAMCSLEAIHRTSPHLRPIFRGAPGMA